MTEIKYVWREGDKILFHSGALSRGDKWEENLKWAVDHGFTVIEELPSWYVRIHDDRGSYVAIVRVVAADFINWCKATRRSPASELSEVTYRTMKPGVYSKHPDAGAWDSAVAAEKQVIKRLSEAYVMNETTIVDPETIKTLIGEDKMTLAPKKTRSTKAMVEKAAKEAAIVAVAMQGEEILFQWAKGATEKHWPELLKTPAGEEVIRLAAPVALHYVLETYGDAIPQREKLLTLCEGATQGNIQRNIGHLFALLQPLLAQVQNLPSKAE